MEKKGNIILMIGLLAIVLYIVGGYIGIRFIDLNL